MRKSQVVSPVITLSHSCHQGNLKASTTTPIVDSFLTSVFIHVVPDADQFFVCTSCKCSLISG